MHIEIPYIRMDMIKVKECPASLCSGVVRWPLRALPPLCDFDEKSGSIEIRSMDETTHLTLHSNRQHVLIRCTIPIPPSNDKAFDLVQRYSILSIPKRYEHAYRLALTIAKRISRSEGIHERTLLAVASYTSSISLSSSCTQYMRTHLPVPVLCSKTLTRPNWDVASKNRLLSVSLRRIMIKLQNQEEEEDDFDLPPMGIRMLVTYDATFEVFSSSDTSSSSSFIRVHAFVNFDGSSLNLCDDFVRHIRPVRKLQYISDSDEMIDQYNVSSLYQVRALPSSSTDYDIASIVLRSRQLRESFEAYSVDDDDNDVDEYDEEEDDKTKNQLKKIIIPHVGRFVQFPDSRVRVTFEDRTIVMLNSKRRSALIVWPNGSSQTISLSPMVLTDRVRPYLEPTLRFATWAKQKPSERARAMQSLLRRKSILKRVLSFSSNNIMNTKTNMENDEKSKHHTVLETSRCKNNTMIDVSIARSHRQIEKIDAIFQRCYHHI